MTLADTLTASMEDYLEAIYNIIAEKEAVRPKDIARRLNVKNSSVTGALRALADKALIRYAPYDVITLTPEGKDAAKDVIRRHEVLRDFFINVLAVNEREADEAACKMEHSIPKGILERFIQFAEFVEVCPRGGANWVEGFGYFCKHGNTKDDCERCISLTLEGVTKEPQSRVEKKEIIKDKLKDLKPGQKGKVVKIVPRGEVNKRIVEMGVTPGSVVEMERIAPMGDSIDIKVKGYHLSLRKGEAEKIEIEPL
ncbi:MAG: DtxR family transcriptional regulator [Acidobacteriota bacterium]|jgi:DtxR family Mn-dependent transcriptional regulator